jgi:hypothetical protein
LATSLLNTVNCSAAPNCSVLNRSPCTTTSHTCGPCYPTYSGDAGDSNSKCVLLAAASPNNGRRYLTAHSCSSNRDCDGFHTCSMDGICTLPPKQCPADCSGHGTCVFVFKDSGLPTRDCRSGFSNCSAVCQCWNDFNMSSSCSVPNNVIVLKQSYRVAVRH